MPGLPHPAARDKRSDNRAGAAGTLLPQVEVARLLSRWFLRSCGRSGCCCWCAILHLDQVAYCGACCASVVRVAVWIVPTCLFVRFVEGPPVLERLGLQANIRKGVMFGFLGFLALAAVIGVHRRFRLSLFAMPRIPRRGWVPILLAPIAEEVLFRGLVFRVLLERLAVWSALVVSALLFALIHLPYWWLSGAASPAGLVLRLGSIFAYGVFFALLSVGRAHSLRRSFVTF